MLWKILSVVAAVLLALGTYFSYTNLDVAKAEKAKLEKAKENLTLVKEGTSKKGQEKVTKTTDLADMKKKQEEAVAELNKTKGEIDKAKAETDGLKTTLDGITKEVATIEDQIQKSGDVKTLTAQVQALDKEKGESEALITTQMQQKEMAEEKIASVAKETKNLQEVDKRQRDGIVEPGFTAHVSQSYPNWGFVVLNKGVSNGMFARTALDVKRGKDVVAKLTVREVETHAAIADLVPGSNTSGNVIRPGDLVVASATQPKIEEEKAALGPAPTPVGGVPPTAAGATPAAPAPGAPAMSDPFGSTPAAPAPGAPAPAAADPFGAPAAPAPAGAPAPQGTPEKPSTADPFAPAPAAGGAAPPATPMVDPFAPKK